MENEKCYCYWHLTDRNFLLLCCPSCKLLCSRPSTTMLKRLVFSDLCSGGIDFNKSSFERKKRTFIDGWTRVGWSQGSIVWARHFVFMAQGRSIKLTLKGGFYKSLGGGEVAGHLDGVASAQHWLGCDQNLCIFMFLLQFDLVRCSYAQ